MPLLSYLFWPNPGNAYYTDPKMVLLLGIGLVLVVASLCLRAWRGGMADHRLKKISASWQSATMWFGCVLLFLVVCRVENIQFLAMRVLVYVWAVVFMLYVLWQLRRFKTKYFQILPRDQAEDARDKYLPKKRR